MQQSGANLRHGVASGRRAADRRAVLPVHDDVPTDGLLPRYRSLRQSLRAGLGHEMSGHAGRGRRLLSGRRGGSHTHRYPRGRLQHELRFHQYKRAGAAALGRAPLLIQLTACSLQLVACRKFGDALLLQAASYKLQAMGIPSDVRARYEKLKMAVNRYRMLYHVYDKEEISAEALDSLKHELSELEAAHPELVTPDSPSQRVAGKPLPGFKKR